MTEDLSCSLCNKFFISQLVKEFHFYAVLNFKYYKCDICGKVISDLLEVNIFHNLFHHLYKYHDISVYVILDYLNLF